ncbi:putative transporter [Rhodotorula toruloides]|nr:putative transporter [Rhodotorula toruloides]
MLRALASHANRTRHAGLASPPSSFSSVRFSHTLPTPAHPLPQRAALPLSLFLFPFGYVAGLWYWSPLSEAYGRRPFFVLGSLGLTAFFGASAAAPSYGALLVLRFFSGFFGAVPMTNLGALTGDIWHAKERGTAMSFYSVATFAGPALGPIIGSFAAYRLSWHWAFIIPCLFSAALCIAVIFFLPETYPPVLVSRLARQLRKETGDDRIRSALELAEMKSRGTPRIQRFRAEAWRLLGTPIVMISTEPIVAAVAAFASCCYALIYLLFEGYPVIFSEVHHLGPGYSSLPFLSILVGAIISVPVTLWYQKLYLRDVKREGRHTPEQRLPPALAGGPMIVVSFLWLGWGGYKPHVHWIVPTLSGVLQGVGSVLIFRSMQTYLIDAYERNAASALASNVVTRSIAGALFPLFAPALFHRLGVQWGCTLLADCMLLLVPVPFLFERYGERLRRRSRFAPGR